MWVAKATSWGVAGLLVLLAIAGCSDDKPDGLAAYTPCETGDSCAVGSCEYDRFLGYTCAVACRSDADCPASADGTSIICGEGTCRPTACEAGVHLDGLACIDGELKHCEGLTDAPCSQCPVCSAGEYCAEETCLPKKLAGQPCDLRLGQCPASSECIQLKLTDGETLYGGQYFCSLPVGNACWEGDPCFCRDGACTYACEVDEDCDDGSECVAKASHDFNPTCRRRCNPAQAGACGENAICSDIALANALGEVNVCMANGERPPRPEGFPCAAAAECLSGQCCPAAEPEAWGSCSGDGGC